MKLFAFAAVAAALVKADPGDLDINHLPYKSEKGQTGYNNCKGRKDSQDSECQTLYVNSIEDFCIYGPPYEAQVSDSEAIQVSWCTKGGHGARIIPDGTITGAHFIRTPNYIQITGVGNFGQMNVVDHGDGGGELDPHGADGTGNPKGGVLVATNNDGQPVQVREWTQFLSKNEFCIRACFPGPDAWSWCEHIYDEQGCWWNEPGNYDPGYFDECQADNVDYPMGVYPVTNSDGATSLSTFQQGWGSNVATSTPPAHNAAPSSRCIAVPTIDGRDFTYNYDSAAEHATTSAPSTPTATSAPQSTKTSASSRYNFPWPFSLPFKAAEPTYHEHNKREPAATRAVQPKVLRSSLAL